MTQEERELAIIYLENIKENYIEGVGYERHPLPEYYAIESAIKALEQDKADEQCCLCNYRVGNECCFSEANEVSQDALISKISKLPTKEDVEGQDYFLAYDVVRTIQEHFGKGEA
jgi:hypothetical protein